MNFKPNCICRPVAEEPVNLPNSGLLSLHAEPGVRPIQVMGGLLELARVKVGVFVRLNASARNCKRIRSPKSTCLNSETSKFTEPGPRATRRAESPKS